MLIKHSVVHEMSRSRAANRGDGVPVLRAKAALHDEESTARETGA